MSLEPIQGNIKKFQSKNQSELADIEIIKNYFKTNFKTNIQVKRIANNCLLIQVSAAGLASNIQLNNQKILSDLNKKVKLNKFSKLNINIGH